MDPGILFPAESWKKEPALALLVPGRTLQGNLPRSPCLCGVGCRDAAATGRGCARGPSFCCWEQRVAEPVLFTQPGFGGAPPCLVGSGQHVGSQVTGASAGVLTYILLDGLFSSPRPTAETWCVCVCVWTIWQKAHCHNIQSLFKGTLWRTAWNL